MKRIFNMLKPVRRVSPLKTELACLIAAHNRTYSWMAAAEREFWMQGGVCCPSCGVPGYADAMLKQERRDKQIAWIKAKLARDQQPKG